MEKFLGKLKRLVLNKKIAGIFFVGLILFPIAAPVLAQSANANNTNNTKSATDYLLEAGKIALNPSAYIFQKAGGAFWNFTISKAASAILMLVSWVSAEILVLEAKLLDFVLDKSVFTKLGIVQLGWRICRDLANLFFIAILMYIGFSVMFQLTKTDYKKLLFQVIVWAVLINFSLSIAGIIVDASQVMFRYFIFGPLVHPTTEGFSSKLADSLQLSKFTVPANDSPTSASDAVLRLVFVVIFSFIAIITFGALVITLLVRNFWIWFLMIVAPIAWFTNLVPMAIIGKYSKEWWNKFLQWCFMAPIVGFFVYLALKIQDVDAQLMQPSMTYGQGTSSKFFSESNNPNSIFNISNIIGMILSVGFIICGIMAGEKLGSKTLGKAMKKIESRKDKATGWLKDVSRRQPMKMAGKGLTSIGNTFSDFSEKAAQQKGIKKALLKLPGITSGLIGKGVGKLGRGATKTSKDLYEQRVKDADKKVGSLSKDQLNEQWNSLDKWEKVAAGKKLEDKMTAERFNELSGLYSWRGMEKEKKDFDEKYPQYSSKREEEGREYLSAYLDFENKLKDYNSDKNNIEKAGALGAAVGELQKKQSAQAKAFKKVGIDDFAKMDLGLDKLFDERGNVLANAQQNLEIKASLLVGLGPEMAIKQLTKLQNPKTQREFLRAMIKNTIAGDDVGRFLANKGLNDKLKNNAAYKIFNNTLLDIANDLNSGFNLSEEDRKNIKKVFDKKPKNENKDSGGGKDKGNADNKGEGDKNKGENTDSKKEENEGNGNPNTENNDRGNSEEGGDDKDKDEDEDEDEE